MPKPFMDAIARGARVRTKRLSGGRYIRIAFLGGKSYTGEVKKRKKRKKSKRKGNPARGAMR